MKKTMNRRMFLCGAGGAVMAIPFLPSLLTRAFAADPGPGEVGKCFMAICTEHGGVWGTNMYPSDASLTQTMYYAGRDVRYGNLPSTPDADGKVVFSPMCSASAQVMTPALAAKFNILRGVDAPYRIGHSLGHQLGNAAESINNGIVGMTPGYQTATIDQVMAHSPSFYTQEDLGSKMTQRSFCVGSGQQSWGFSSPSTKTGAVIQRPSQGNNKRLFDHLFNPGTSLYNIDEVIIDRVKASYDRLKKDPRLSKGDLARLNQHVERMFEIERKLLVTANMGDPPIEKPAVSSNANFDDAVYLWNPENNAKACHLINDIIVAAFESGVSRVGTWKQGYFFVGGAISDWHGNVAHGGLGAAESQKKTLAWNQGTFEHAMVDLAAKLDNVTTADGKTLLDSSLLMWSSEYGDGLGHATDNIPTVLAGTVGGLGMGRYLDYFGVDGHCVNQIYVALLQAFGEADSTFGNHMGSAAGPLPGILT